MADSRLLPVPDGLAGERLDAGVARLLGLSRTAVAAMVDAGDVLVDGIVVPRSHRLMAGSWLDVTLPAPPASGAVIEPDVTGLVVLQEDTDIIVVN